MKVYKPTSGFTLVELLVVIAIIAVLAALLFPVFNSVRAKGRENSCTSNLHQIGIAIKAYQEDKHAYPPPPSYDGNRYQGGISALFPEYITDKGLFFCPDDMQAQKDGKVARQKVYSSYNGMVDPATWDFVVDANGRQRLYNYFGYNSDGYDVFTPATCVSPTNSALPAFLASDGLGWRFYPRLMNRYSPDNTIITHCPYHRSRYGATPDKQMDIVLRLGGRTEKAVVGPMSTADATGVAPWVHQK